MATFPALIPTARRYNMGVFPATEEQTPSSGAVRFRHGIIACGHNLELSFTALTENQAQLLRNHYREQQGGFISFSLSPEAWAGHTTFTDLVPTSTFWCYAAQLQEEHLATGHINVQVTLISVL